MPLNAVDITNLGNAHAATLGPLVAAAPNAPVAYNSGAATTATGFAADLANAFAAAAPAQSTVAVDTLIRDITKPSFPFRPWLLTLIDALDALNATQVPVNNGLPIPANIFKPAELASFADIALFACGDAASFPGNIADDQDYYYESQVINRAYRAHTDSRRNEQDLAAQRSGPSELSPPHAPEAFADIGRSIRTSLLAARMGVCFTFAWGGVAPLLDRMHRGQSGTAAAAPTLNRLEIVAVRNHVFVLINRAGPAVAPGQVLPAPAGWGGAAVITLDLWLGSLGHGYVFTGINGPNMNFLHRTLKSHFDSAHHNWRGV